MESTLCWQVGLPLSKAVHADGLQPSSWEPGHLTVGSGSQSEVHKPKWWLLEPFSASLAFLLHLRSTDSIGSGQREEDLQYISCHKIQDGKKSCVTVTLRCLWLQEGNETLWASKNYSEQRMHVNSWWGIRGALLSRCTVLACMLLYVATADQGNSFDFKSCADAYQNTVELNLQLFWRAHQRATWQVVSGNIKTPSVFFSLSWSPLKLPRSVIDTDGLLCSQLYLRSTSLFFLKCFLCWHSIQTRYLEFYLK